ncbi:hypothetical protein C7M84_005481 [Penaeus vannamei]|uniref:C-type lectin domain-containing protein n=1 Tax=Penaeus vannamei TaxID=6689 RepID=A0A3R7M8L8_PENVA|nr:hypothetical protein C7M84_005481 [Penaeus vannamei]
MPNTDITKLHLYVRSQDYDRNYTCPPILGVDHGSLNTTINGLDWRGEGAVASYTCHGDLFMEGPGESMEGKTTEGTIVCQRQDDGTLAWNRTVELPCRLTCPDNYAKTEDGDSCVSFSTEPVVGISRASLRCRDDGASLANIERAADLDTAERETYYFTAHVSQKGNNDYMPPPPDADCENQCDTSNRVQCLALKIEGGGNLKKKRVSCEDGILKYACQKPAYCPVGFHAYNGLCYHVIQATGENLKSFEEAQLKCGDMASSLAFPESRDALEYIADLVRHYETPSQYLRGAIVVLHSDGLSNGETASRALGVVSRWGNWTAGDFFYPEENFLETLSETEDFYYRFITVESTGYSLEPSLAEASQTVGFAVCQRYGPIACYDPLPLPTVNMSFSWNEKVMVKEGKANYTCYPGYFAAWNKNVTQQTLSCHGILGGWRDDETDAPAIFDCYAMEGAPDDLAFPPLSPVCNDLPLPPSPLIVNYTNENTSFVNGSVSYACPGGLAAGNKSVLVQTLTCVQGNEIKFEPEVVEPCDGRHTILLLLLLCGDTGANVNPGPCRPKHPCMICTRAVKWGQRAIQCDNCCLPLTPGPLTHLMIISLPQPYPTLPFPFLPSSLPPFTYSSLLLPFLPSAFSFPLPLSSPLLPSLPFLPPRSLLPTPLPLLLPLFLPASTNTEYLQNLELSLTRINEDKDIWLTGDFNLPDIDWTALSPHDPPLTDLTAPSFPTQTDANYTTRSWTS